MVSTQPGPASHRGPRAPRRTGRLVVGIVVIALLIAGGTTAAIAAMRGGKATATTSLDTPKPQTSDANTTPSPTPSDASPTPTPSTTADAAFAACRTTVTAAEAVVVAARTGAKDWTIHTQARTDFLAHRITLAQTNAEFKKTRERGPADQSAFGDALSAYEAVADGCNGASTASQPAAACATKAAALKTTVVAGQAVMKDWASHLNNMALHAEDEMSATQARSAWIAAWKSAPANLNAFKSADKASTNAPSCPPAA